MLDRLLEIRGYKLTKKTKDEYCTSCPFCGGTDRFIVNIEKDRYWCRQCNKKGDSIQLLRDLDGLSFKDAKWAIEKMGGNSGRPQKDPPRKQTKNPVKSKEPFIHPTLGTPSHKWKYIDEKGHELFVVCRFDLANGDKDMRQCLPDGLTWKIDGVRRVLFNLPALLPESCVWMVEGEKCVDALTSLGFMPATTSPMGAGKWLMFDGEYKIGKPLQGKTIYILPDNDEPGRKHAEDIAQSLYGKAKVFFIELPGLPEKGDVCDYLEQHGKDKTVADIMSLVSKAKPWQPPADFFTVEDLLTTKFELHPAIIDAGIMPYGSHIIIAGEAGVGKSLFRMELGLHLVMGWDWLGFKVPTARKIAVFQYENTEAMEQTRLNRMIRGLGIERLPKNSIVYVDRKNRLDLTLKRDRTKLEELVKKSGAEVLFYDCLSNFHTMDENKNSAMREILDTFTEINAKAGTSCVVIHHFGKPTEGQKNQYRTRGAQSILDWAVTAMGFMAKNHETRVLRMLEFFKVRDGAKPKPMILERDEAFLLTLIEEDTLCPPAKVREILDNLGGEVEKQSLLVDAIIDEVDCSERSARTFIRRAVEMRIVKEKWDGMKGHAKGYFVNQ